MLVDLFTTDSRHVAGWSDFTSSGRRPTRDVKYENWAARGCSLQGLPRAAVEVDSDGMRGWGQWGPIAFAAEVFAERWTPIIIRNLHLGCRPGT